MINFIYNNRFLSLKNIYFMQINQIESGQNENFRKRFVPKWWNTRPSINFIWHISLRPFYCRKLKSNYCNLWFIFSLCYTLCCEFIRGVYRTRFILYIAAAVDVAVEWLCKWLSVFDSALFNMIRKIKHGAYILNNRNLHILRSFIHFAYTSFHSFIHYRCGWLKLHVIIIWLNRK